MSLLFGWMELDIGQFFGPTLAWRPSENEDYVLFDLNNKESTKFTFKRHFFVTIWCFFIKILMETWNLGTVLS